MLCCTIMHGLSFRCSAINHSGLYCTSELEPCIILQHSTKIEIYFVIHVYACANRVYCTVISTIHLYLYSILKPNKSLRLLDNFFIFISINNIIIYMVKQAIKLYLTSYINTLFLFHLIFYNFAVRQVTTIQCL